MAEPPDTDQLTHLAAVSHKESRFGYIPFSEEKVRKVIQKALIDRKRNGLMIAQKNEQIIGAAYCSIGELHIGTEVLLTTIHNINVLKTVRSSLLGGRSALGLLKGIETWSEARNAHEILFHVTSGVDLARVHKLVKGRGYILNGQNYAKNIFNK